MLPLGDRWDGVCRANPDAPATMGGTDAGLCNMGFARGECVRFPVAEAPDAARFALKGDNGGSLRLDYVTERDFLPVAHGTLEYSIGRARLVAPPESETLGRQAEAYSESYLRRKRGAR